MRIRQFETSPLLFSCVLFCVSTGTALAAGPFGLERGMTQQQIVKIVGQSAVKQVKGNALIVTTVPSPHEAFESYSLIISPAAGLLKIIAIGKDIKAGSYGDDLVAAFSAIDGAVSKVYDGRKSFNYLRSGSIWNERNEWMMGLLKKERTLVTYWKPSGNPNHITVVALEATALSQDTGFITLSYEFEGWEAYLDSEKDKKDSVF